MSNEMKLHFCCIFVSFIFNCIEDCCLLMCYSERMTARQCMEHEWLHEIFHEQSYHLPVSKSQYALLDLDGDEGDKDVIDDEGKCDEEAETMDDTEKIDPSKDLNDTEEDIEETPISLSGKCVSQNETTVVRSGSMNKSDSREKVQNQVSEMSVTEGDESNLEISDVGIGLSGKNENQFLGDFGGEIQQRLGGHGDTLDLSSSHKDGGFLDIPGNTVQNDESLNCDTLTPQSHEIDSGLGITSEVGSLDAQSNDSACVGVDLEMVDQEANMGDHPPNKNVDNPRVNQLDQNEDSSNLVIDTENVRTLNTSANSEKDTESMDVSENEAPKESDESLSTNNNATRECEVLNAKNTTFTQQMAQTFNQFNQSSTSGVIPSSFNFRDIHKTSSAKSTPAKVPAGKMTTRSSIGHIDDSVHGLQLGERQKRAMCNDVTSPGTQRACTDEDAGYEFVSVSKRVRSYEDSLNCTSSPEVSPKIAKSPRIRRHDRSHHQHHH